MPDIVPEKQRQFAVDVVRRLRDQGFEAYWAGGCVRDQLLARAPYDYDVATSARPDDIQRVFHDRHTLAIGAAFGVITVVGPRGAGQIEVTTFRQDAAYSDGRHPDHVSFSSPEEDARRRDFTINGMFYDPVENRVIDFVGGEVDLRQKIVRAIGDAHERFTEDKLRMLRAVRFAAIFDFHLDQATLDAIREMAAEVTVVSAERIAAEVRIMLVHPSRVRALELLRNNGLLGAIWPELAELSDGARNQSLAVSGALGEATVPLALAAALYPVAGEDVAEAVGSRWKLARKEIDRLKWLMDNKRALADARDKPWSSLQPLLVHEGAEELLALHDAATALGVVDRSQLDYCRQQLEMPAAELDPPPLIDGQDLIALGIPRGPAFARLLKAARDAQLDSVVKTKSDALDFVRRQSNAAS